ncbi:multiple sugar transport system permease protein [Paenibacillus sp. UNC496MF]|uniref:carbohydrate ABC transporter permease n=1 Tax=Paenibacillus sp. UNC496MF TaxID=1502753 RepID=UPI0008E6B426|nr:sugar ABC transporter permease [Paenibacillus sp. UNC496MF]SFJ82591.1 multiple sugar transport system permease protein [Paenibacillus sp. UNC496MF]
METRLGHRLKEYALGYLFILPWLIGFVAFMLWPFIHSFYLALTDYRFADDYAFVGIDNFTKLFQDDDRFLKSLWVTTKLVLLSVPLKLAFALLVAIVLNKGISGLSFYRTVYYLPSIVGGSVAVSIMWMQIFGREGLLNLFLHMFGIQAKDWIFNPDSALYTIVILMVWQFGSSMLIFLAGLKQVPKEMYEAVSIDGAGKWTRFLHITLPLISPVLFFNLIMQTIQTFQTFTQGYVITKGGPMDETLFMVIYIYQQAFSSLNMGYAQAISWVLLAIIGAATALNFFASRYWVHYEDSGSGKKG